MRTLLVTFTAFTLFAANLFSGADDKNNKTPNLFDDNVISGLVKKASVPKDVDKRLHTDCLYPTVMIRTKAGALGSGVIVRSEKQQDGLWYNVVLSCAHICSKCDKIYNDPDDYSIRLGVYKDWSTFKGCINYSAIVYTADTENDLLVLLFISKKKMPIATLDFKEKLYIGNEVIKIGCGSDQMRVDYGRVTSVNSQVDNNTKKDAYRLSVYTVPGDSGGPVFKNYKVVGFIQAVRGVRLGWVSYPAFGISLAIPTKKIKMMDKKLNKATEFVWKEDEALPQMSFFRIHLSEYKTNKRYIPQSIWSK